MNKHFLLATLCLCPLGLYAHKATDSKATTLKSNAPVQRVIRGIDEDKTRQRFTLSGYVKDRNGEPLINATIYDLTTRQGTMTNAYGHFSLTLGEGRHEIRCSYVGYKTLVETIELTANQNHDIILQNEAQLDEVVVTTDLNSPLLKTQTGKISLSPKDIKTEYALLSSPDVIKTLQRTSGVSDGMELASGLYVHGGNGDENLFLLDGTPLYHTNHTLGLFSSFNADVVKNVDFYKSGFPARYGGRLSSVIDVRTADGDLYNTHGSYRIGLLDGAFHIEGPIRKGKTSYNFGLRRSWLDLLTRPAFAIMNSKSDNEDKLSMSYFFHDLNFKLTNIFNERSRMSLSVYSGEDRLDAKDEWLFANFTAVYTHNRSTVSSSDEWRFTRPGEKEQLTLTSHGYRSSIDDLGYRAAFDFRPNPRHHIRFGHDYTYHRFQPQTTSRFDSYQGEGMAKTDTIASHSHNKNVAHQLTFYAEDEMMLNEKWSLNGGVNADVFHISGKTFSTLSPRLAMKFQPNDRLSFKASYTLMSQFVHKIANSFLDLPTDYWVPTTARLHPMRSWQVAAGAYMKPNKHWLLSLEAYYKRSSHILQYSSWVGLEPPAANWDYFVMEGEGRSYGVELDADYKISNLNLHGSYTLSWAEKKFDDFYDGWYYDKFDNRHKLTLTGRWNITKKIAAFAAWTFRTGNRMTIPTQYIGLPNVPDQSAEALNFTLNSDGGLNFAYEKPNNIILPAYHRLDIGFDFRHTTKKGNERIWNLSFYNAYCHLNSMWVRVKNDDKKQMKIKNMAFIPVIPSFSYTFKF